MSPNEFIEKWSRSQLRERAGSQEHFIDLCRLLSESPPAEDDPTGEQYCFDRGTLKDSGGKGWADVWKRHCFAWEYKGKHADLDKAFNQLRQYALALENPPLLIVSDMVRFRIHTNWTNSVSIVHEFTLDELRDGGTRNKLKWAMSDPDRLKPGETRQTATERAAQTFAKLAQALRDRGHDPHAVAHFVNRLVFCMFAEDVGLLPNHMFTRLLERTRSKSDEFVEMAGKLFKAMATGGDVGFERVEWFNGGLFDDDAALPLTKGEIDIALQAAALDWSDIDPSIFGTLFERGLDPSKRSQLGAHYTDHGKIMQIVEPVIIKPLLDRWQTAKAEIEDHLTKADGAKASSTRTRRRKKAEALLIEFLEELRNFVVLDPACGSGNFLYLALHALKDLEHRVQLEAETLGLQRKFPSVGPANVKGIEINPYAAELARVSIWIGEIQWMKRNGFEESREPILKPLETIECRDAILTTDGHEADWPATDVVIGNPPFLGYVLQREVLGGEYTQRMRQAFRDQIPAISDLVCYWFRKVGKLVLEGKITCAGLIATNSIRSGKNRQVLEDIVKSSAIYEAWSDEEWNVDGAAVRVSVICIAPKDFSAKPILNGEQVANINSDLTAATDLTQAKKLPRNKSVAFVGGIKKGKFDIPGDLARQWLQLPANPNGESNADVLKPWSNGMDVTRRPSGRWVIDFGHEISKVDAALYEAPFAHVLEHVKPSRDTNNRRDLKEYWWRHDRSGQTMFRSLGRLRRYIVTPAVAKHRLFVWFDSRICPDHALTVIAREDDTTFGILHSRFHEAWALRRGSTLVDRPCYTPTTTFATFPFPQGLTPDIPASSYANNPRAIAIADAAQYLVKLRDAWLNPPEWIEWVDEPVAGYPKRPVLRDQAAAQEIRRRTLTKLYNQKPQWLSDAHAKLDAAVAMAYGWPTEISERDALDKLLAMNMVAHLEDSE